MPTEDRAQEILQELVEHIEENRSDAKSVFEENTTTDAVMDEDLPVALNGVHCVSTRIGYAGGELYDIYVVKI